MRRLVLLIVAVAVMTVGVLTGPAGAAKTKKITDCKKDKDLAANITKAFNTYLGGTTTAEKMTYIQDAAKLTPISDKGAAAAAAAGQTTSDTATQIYKLTPTCDGKKAATFTYDLGRVSRPITGPPSTGFGLSFAGDAVLDKKKGVWLISSATICDLIGQNPNTPGLGAECLAAIG
jgi:hypothetical protein